MSYRVSIKKKAAKALDKIPKGIREKIDAKIEGLKKDPRDGSEKLQGFEDTYRFRQGDYRVIYEINDDELIIAVIKVSPRGDAYKE